MRSHMCSHSKPVALLSALFIVQGEGRGHMTQALALKHHLEQAGHRVAGMLVGGSAERRIPTFFLKKAGVPVHVFDSPNFKRDGANRGISYPMTLAANARRLGLYIRSLCAIHRAVRQYRPDILVNFYEPLGGLYHFLFRPPAPMMCVGHQYLSLHPEFLWPKGDGINRFLFSAYTRLTRLGARWTVALSFRRLPNCADRGLRVAPPLLRDEFGRLKPVDRNFYLAYVLNAGYAADLIRTHEKTPEAMLHVFWDNPDAPETVCHDAGLTFHRLDDTRFLTLLSQCSGYMSTAGFESICEAISLGKPVLVVPAAGHFEKRCNALEVGRSGVGLARDGFDVAPLETFRTDERPHLNACREWIGESRRCFERIFFDLARTRRPIGR